VTAVSYFVYMCVCVCVPPAVIFRGVRIPESHKQNFAAWSTTQITESGYVNEMAFLEYLRHFKKHCVPKKYLIELGGHVFH
jgi:hypothetical protein